MLVAYITVLALASGAAMADYKAVSSSAKAEVESSHCAPTCAVPSPYCLEELLNLTYGTQCQSGYILSEFGGECVKIENCPKDLGCNGDPHARIKKCPLPCPSTCEAPDAVDCKKKCEPVGCECEIGYILSERNGKCVLPDECKGGNPCGPNGTFAQCISFGPYDYCPVDDSRDVKIYEFYPFPPCYPGCICNQNYRRMSYEDSRCILASDCRLCPRCGVNEKPVNNKVLCPPDTCESIYSSYTCEGVKPTKCGCRCINEYLRNSDNICVPSEKCPSPKPVPQCGTNEEPFENEVMCPPDTCESIYTSYMCQGVQPTDFGCKCINGTLRDSNNICVPSEKCPPPNPCGPNGTLADCGFRCPNQYCPDDDSQLIILCKPPRDCPSGCLCKENYKRISADDRCVLASDCPRVNCTRPNEVWDPCSRCLAERCSDVPTPCDDPNCNPRCVCAEGHCRNDDDICVPKKTCSNPNPNECIATCAVPTPKNCKYSKPPAANDKGCQSQCTEGYIMSENGGKCIKIEDCPKDLGCNGDPNARVKLCPQPCPSTCNSPNATPCKRKCDPVGCECNPGYILSEIDGKCILPDNCTGGNPCGPSGRFVECRSNCPYDYCPVDDSQATVACEYPPFAPCFSGCICGLNHRRLSYSDERCVVSSDCPPVNCTRINEEWAPCPSDCLSELCEDVDKKPTTCNTLVLNCQPKCICKKNHFRNKSNVCVSAKVCRKLNAMNTSCGE